MYSNHLDAFHDFDFLEILWKDEDFICYDVRRHSSESAGIDHIALMPSSGRSSGDALRYLSHEYELRDRLQATWAIRPVELLTRAGQKLLLLERPAGKPVAHRISTPIEIEDFLCVATAMAKAVSRMHEADVVHRNIRPRHFWWDEVTSCVRITGFGSAGRLSNTSDLADNLDVPAGAWPYIAPEQTGRTNHPIDARSDLYSLGISLYQILTGELPFLASDRVELLHCHLARLPAAPHEMRRDIPQPLSAIVMKLLAKAPDERYQAAIGLEKDLLHCLQHWRRSQRIDPFEIGARDIGHRLSMPKQLYGRANEREELVRASNRVKDTGLTELVLVSGYAGAGKSALVAELAKVQPEGLFAAGKFDQYKRNIPYATIAQAFEHLVAQLLNMREPDLALWRESLQEALGRDGQLVTNLIPHLTLIVGEQPPVSPVDPQDAKARFHNTFERFLGVFARQEHPLTLFVDDLQWLDIATLELVEFLITEARAKYLLLIGAYRDNEIGDAHVLRKTIEAIKTRGGRLTEINIDPLPIEPLAQLLADAMHDDLPRVHALAALLLEKTGGNPFFAIQFLGELVQEGLLAVDPESSRWDWNLDGIRSKNISENVADLVAAKLNRLPAATRSALGQIACLGHTVDWRTAAAVRGSSEENVKRSLRSAVDGGLLVASDSHVSFAHDRVHEAAYAAIPPSQRPQIHLQIARNMLSVAQPADLDERVFEIVDQFNRGIARIELTAERVQVAGLNLVAGKRAQTASAYASALRYFEVGRELLPEDRWQSCYGLALDLERHCAECHFVLGNLAVAEDRLSVLANLAATIEDESEVVCLQLLVYFNAGKQEAAIQLGFNFLDRLGTVLPLDAGDEAVQREYERMCVNLDGRSIEDLSQLSQMTSPESLATMKVLTELYPAASTSEHRSRALADLIILRMTNLSLQYGNCDASSVAYSGLSLFLAPRFGDYRTAYRFGRLACLLAESHGTPRSRARAYAQVASFAMPWFDGFEKCQSLLSQAFDDLRMLGDNTFAAYTLRNLVTNLLVSGADLEAVMQRADEALAFARNSGLHSIAEPFVGHRRVVASLRGIELQDPLPPDDWARQPIGEQRGVGKMASYHWAFKLQERYFAGDYVGATEAAKYVEPIRWAMQAGVEEAIYEFYAALAHAAMCDAGRVSGEEHYEWLRTHLQRISNWAEQCPSNFAHWQALVSAELARVEERHLEAQRLYEKAIKLSSYEGFLQDKALACELAARYHRGQGLDRIAESYTVHARSCYVKWGAFAKVRELDRLYPQSADDVNLSWTGGSSERVIEQLDLATVLRVSQAVSSEIVLEKLIATLTRLAVEHAGAERGLLILQHEDQFVLEAEAITERNTVSVRLERTNISPLHLPEAALNYVVRTKENLLLHDASAESAFSSDSYIRRSRARSVLCMPLLNQGRLLGVLYLENSLAPATFTPARISVLKLLASTAAISLENTRLYTGLRERESRVRRLVESNIVGIFLWDVEGHIIEANDAFLRIIQYTREEFARGSVQWKDLTPAEWEGIDQLQLARLREFGAAAPYEKEFFRKDGGRAPVLIGAAVFDETPTQGVAFVLDLTERNRAERQYREAQMQLIHANRVATIGQLSASIAHELNQPLAGIITNANTCLAMLASHTPNVAGAAETARRAIRDAKRASDVINRVRSLFSRDDAKSEPLDLSDIAREVLEIFSAEFRRENIHVEAALSQDRLPFLGDRIQLQQVILNLLQNALDSINARESGPRSLKISTEPDDAGNVLLSVQDSGGGFDSHLANKLFDPFYTTKHDGMGIGLSVSRSIVEAHSGRIWAKNASGSGAIVTFALPAKEH